MRYAYKMTKNGIIIEYDTTSTIEKLKQIKKYCEKEI